MADYTDYQQRALYGAGQSASRAGQLFHQEGQALREGDKREAKYLRTRANALNRQGAYAAVRGMGGNEGTNPYFPTQNDGQPIYSTNFPGQFALSSQGKEVFDQFRDLGFVEPIRQKKRYAPNTEPKGLGYFLDKVASSTIGGKILSSIGKQKPKPDDAYYSSLWGKGLNEMYSPSGIFSAGEFLGKPNIDPYYRKNYTGPEFLRGLLEPFHKPRSDAFGVVRDSSIPEDWEFMQEKPLDALSYNEIPKIPFMGESMDIEDLSYEPETVWGPEGDPSIMMAGMEPEPFFSGYDNSVTIEDITDAVVGDSKDTITNSYMEEVTDPKNISPYNYDQYYHLNPSMPGGTSDFSGVQEYLDKLTKDPDNPYYKRDEEELLRELIKRGHILEGKPQNIDLETRDAEENLKDINRLIQEEYDKQKELGFRYDT